MEAKVPFVACDNSHATPLTIHILAAVAEAEAKAIAERTVTALRAAKRRGVKLGSSRPGHWTGREQQRAKGLRKAVKVAGAIRSRVAAEAYAFLVPELTERRERGDTLDGIATWLNTQGHSTRAGKP